MNKSIESKTAIGFVLALLIIVFFTVSTFFNLHKLITENRQNGETQMVLKSIDSIKYHLIAAESAGRAYALSGNEKFRSTYVHSMQSAGSSLNRLTGMLLTDEKDSTQKKLLLSTFSSLHAFGNRIILAKQQQGTNAALELFLNGKLAADANRVILTLQKIESRHRDKLTLLAENNITQANDTVISFLLLIVVILVLLTVVYYFFRKDLTLRRMAEQELLKLNEELEIRVKKRTEQLLDNEKKLNYKINELNSFMYKATHDLRSPLVSLMGLIHAAEGEVQGNPNLLEYFEMINKSAMNMEKLLLDLFSITNLKEGRLTSNKISFEKIVSDVLDSLKHYPSFEKIVIRKNINEAVPFYNDGKLLYSVIQNLIDNAIKYRRQDAEIASVVNISIESNEQAVVINISDNGIGIIEKEQQKVFDIFYRATNVASGTGLGLHIVKTSIEKMGGNITLKSGENSGTSIYVTLPNVKNIE